MVSTLEQMHAPIGTRPGARRSRRPLRSKRNNDVTPSWKKFCGKMSTCNLGVIILVLFCNLAALDHLRVKITIFVWLSCVNYMIVWRLLNQIKNRFLHFRCRCSKCLVMLSTKLSKDQISCIWEEASAEYVPTKHSSKFTCNVCEIW